MCKTVLASAVILALLSGCGDSTSPSYVIPQGNWAGSTFNGDQITFTVTDTTIDSLHASVICMFSTLTDTVNWHVYNISITDDHFFRAESLGTNPSYYMSIEGTFQSDSVSGTFVNNGTYDDGSGTETYTDSSSWQAGHL